MAQEASEPKYRGSAKAISRNRRPFTPTIGESGASFHCISGADRMQPSCGDASLTLRSAYSGSVTARLAVHDRRVCETRFLQNLFVGVIYVAAGLATVAKVFDMPVGGLLAASGVIAILLGVALRSSLGDVFSGIVLNVAKPYHPGDWIILDGGTQGCVVETDWRATHSHARLPDNDLAIVPNSIIAKARLINASQPVRAHGLTIIIRLEPTVTPSGGRVALQAMLLSCNRILRRLLRPSPFEASTQSRRNSSSSPMSLG